VPLPLLSQLACQLSTALESHQCQNGSRNALIPGSLTAGHEVRDLRIAVIRTENGQVVKNLAIISQAVSLKKAVGRSMNGLYLQCI